MRLLLVHRYFWPDTPPYASMLRTIAEGAAQAGHEVTVLTAQPSYGGSHLHERAPSEEEIGGVRVKRVRLLSERKTQMGRRAANLALFAAQVFVSAARRGRQDVVMAATTPPILVALAAMLGARIGGARFVYHMQDIYPEVLAPAEQGRFHRLLRRIDSVTTANADRVVVLSRDMATTLSARRGGRPTTHTINNFLPDRAHSEEASDQPDTTRFRGDSFQVVFAGNLGRFQGLDVAIAAVKQSISSGVECHLVLLGDGVASDELKVQAGDLLDDRIFFPGRVSQGAAEAVVADSDLALVTLQRGLIRAAYPSKTMTYLASGTRVLAAVESDSELAEMIVENGLGSACTLDADEMATAIERLASQPAEHSDRVRRFAEETASAEARVADWLELFEGLAR